MVQPVPLIFTWRPQTARLNVVGRLVAFAIASACLAVLIAAFVISPDTSGVGSHRQIGLPACQFEQRTGVPCPTCGMTTSFAHFARGNLAASLYVQPMGSLLAFATAMTFWAALYIALTARPAHRLFRLLPMRYHLVPLFAFAILAWVWKIWVHLKGIDGWH